MTTSNLSAASFIKLLAAKIMAFILAVTAIFNGTSSLGEVKLEIAEPVTTETQVIEVSMTNYSGRKISFDEAFTVEINNNGAWEKVAFSDDYYINAVSTEISSFSTHTFKINIIEAFGKALEAGQYRLSKITHSQARNIPARLNS